MLREGEGLAKPLAPLPGRHAPGAEAGRQGAPALEEKVPALTAGFSPLPFNQTLPDAMRLTLKLGDKARARSRGCPSVDRGF